MEYLIFFVKGSIIICYWALQSPSFQTLTRHDAYLYCSQAIPKIINLLDVDQNRDEVVVEKAVEVIWNLAGIDSNRASILCGGWQRCLKSRQRFAFRPAPKLYISSKLKTA